MRDGFANHLDECYGVESGKSMHQLLQLRVLRLGLLKDGDVGIGIFGRARSGSAATVALNRRPEVSRYRSVCAVA
jgi:hypothetical protein